jgi:hypothetical protein
MPKHDCLPPPRTGRADFPHPALTQTLAAVGSEEARLRAGHRPPLKLHVRFSRMQLSRRLLLSGCNRRN